MKYNLSAFAIALFLTVTNVNSQTASYPFSVKVNVSDAIKENFKENGRFYLFLSTNPNDEPRTQTWPSPTNKTYIFAKNISDFNPKKTLEVKHNKDWISTVDWTLDEVPAGEYYVQILWDQDFDESRIDAPGNLYSETQKISMEQAMEIDLTLSKSIGQRNIIEHNLAKEVDMKSEVLSAWWKKPIHLKASVLLPHNYDSKKEYPIRYNVAGYGGRYTRINYMLGSENFMKWWDSPEAPQIITVFLDGEGPFGDSYQMDSENSGPYGEALISEFIPFIESKYRGTNDATMRFVDGCSTGGWVSLGLQLYYPDTFNGVYSYSPDAVEFENYQLINIYKDENAYVNEYGYKRPVMRSTMGEPMLSLQEFVQYENVLGSSNTYLNSGGQFSAHTALYSPKGSNGLPQPLIDPTTGVIDSVVAKHWKKYDFKIHAKENWAELGPKIQGKIYIWMGDMDHFYLNPATRAFADFLEETQNPHSDAEIVFSPMEGHCSQYSHKVVLEKIQARVTQLKTGNTVK